MKFVEKSAKTVDEAIQLALDELKANREQVEVEITEQPAKGIFGIIGTRMAKVKVTLKEVIKEVKNEKPAFEKRDIRDKREVREIRQPRDARESRPPADFTKDKETAKKFLRDVLTSMDVRAEIRIKENSEGLYINLSGPKMGIIIGRRGQTLDSLQYLVSLVVNKDKEKDTFTKVVLDTEDYRRKREETLNRLATRLADRVIKSGKKVELEPMNPYERRIIHSALQNYSEITTYSEGEEPFRKVIIAHK